MASPPFIGSAPVAPTAPVAAVPPQQVDVRHRAKNNLPGPGNQQGAVAQAAARQMKRRGGVGELGRSKLQPVPTRAPGMPPPVMETAGAVAPAPVAAPMTWDKAPI